jgi:hypothetical protein
MFCVDFSCSLGRAVSVLGFRIESPSLRARTVISRALFSRLDLIAFWFSHCRISFFCCFCVVPCSPTVLLFWSWLRPLDRPCCSRRFCSRSHKLCLSRSVPSTQVSEGFGSSSSAQRRRACFATEDFSSVEKLPVCGLFFCRLTLVFLPVLVLVLPSLIC